MFTTYAFSATWTGATTNWRGGDGPTRWPQQARRATVRANPHEPERATARAGGARARVAGTARASGPSGRTNACFVALPLKIVHDEVLAQF
jgi:hypothetical protein